MSEMEQTTFTHRRLRMPRIVKAPKITQPVEREMHFLERKPFYRFILKLHNFAMNVFFAGLFLAVLCPLFVGLAFIPNFHPMLCMSLAFYSFFGGTSLVGIGYFLGSFTTWF